MDSPLSLKTRTGTSSKSNMLGSSSSVLHSKIRILCQQLAEGRPGGCSAIFTGRAAPQSKNQEIQLYKQFWEQLLSKDFPNEENGARRLRGRIQLMSVDIFESYESYGLQDPSKKFVKLAEDLCHNRGDTGKQILEFLLDFWKPQQLVKRDDTQHLASSCATDEYFGSTSGNSMFRKFFVHASNSGWRNLSRPSIPGALPLPPPSVSLSPLHTGPNKLSYQEASIGVKPHISFLLSSREVSDLQAAACQRQLGDAVAWNMSCSQFIDEVGRTAVGLPTILFVPDGETNLFRLARKIFVQGFSPQVIRSVSEQSLTAGHCVIHIRQFIATSERDNHPGFTFQHFLSAVKTYLAQWIINVQECQHKLTSILIFSLKLESFLLPIETVAEICREVFAALNGGTPLRSFVLLQLLYIKCLAFIGMTNLLPVGLFLLEETAKPFFSFATDLAVNGRFNDPHNEFGIVVDQNVATRSRLSFWDDVVVLQETIPSFLSDILPKLVRCGKCLFLLRFVCPHHPILASGFESPSPVRFGLRFSTDQHQFRQKLQQYSDDMAETIKAASGVDALNLNTGLRNTCFHPGSLGNAEYRFEVFQETISDVQDFAEIWQRYHHSFKVIMHQELLPVVDVQERLADIAVIRLLLDTLGLSKHVDVLRNYFFLENGEFACTFVSKIYEKASKCSLVSCLDFTALLMIFDLSMTDQVRFDENVSKRLTLLSTYSSAVSKKSAPYDVDEYLGLDYKIDWPLNLIITADLLNKCNSVFRRLLKIKGCGWAMNNAYVLLTKRKGVENQVNKRLLSAYRHEMGHVIRVFETYILDIGVQSSWKEQQVALNTATCFEDVRNSVAVYISNVHSRCIMDVNTKFTRLLGEVFRHTLRFYSELRAGASFSDLQRTFLIFQKCALYIYFHIEKRKSVPVSFEVESFLTRLDFSGYYAKRCANTVAGGNRSPFQSPYGTL